MIRALIAGALLFAPWTAWAQTRVALLIGEGAYARPAYKGAYYWPQLANPPHDVGLVAARLKEDGFDVAVATDVDRAAFEKAIAAFALKAAGAEDALVYYAGHGFEYDRHNYLVPIDAPTSVDAGRLGKAYVDLDELARAAGRARRVNIFFMDACRTGADFVKLTGPSKPYVDDVEFKPGTPLAVIYSTARGEPAFDHAPSAPPPLDYSPFAWFVSRFVATPGISLGDFSTYLTAKVEASTRDGGPQSPYMLSSLTQLFYFRPAAPIAATLPAAMGDAQASALHLSIDHLAVTDEPVVVADVLAAHTPAEIAGMAQGGDVIAAYLIGYMFEFGRGVPQDLGQARAWLEKAAVSGLAPAQLELGYFLEQHGAGAEDKARARWLMEAASEQGFAKAQAHLASLLMSDKAPADYQRGVELLRAAAARDYPYAVYALAWIDEPGAAARLAMLAAKGDLASRQWACELGAKGGSIAAVIPDCAAAAKAGYAISQARLAIACHDGDGVKVDPDDARHWERLAIAQPDLEPDLQAKLRTFGY